LLFVLGYIFHDWRFNSIAFLDWFCDPFWFFFDLWMQILAFWSFFCWLVQSFSVKIFVSLLTCTHLGFGAQPNQMVWLSLMPACMRLHQLQMC
jgi:hypothetical protein